MNNRELKEQVKLIVKNKDEFARKELAKKITKLIDIIHIDAKHLRWDLKRPLKADILEEKGKKLQLILRSLMSE